MKTFISAAAAVMILVAPALAQPAPRTPAELEVARAPQFTAPMAAAPSIAVEDAQPQLTLMYVSALAGGATGLVLGAVAGSRMEQAQAGRCHDGCGLGGAMLGGWLGSSVGAATGAGLANGFDGNVLLGSAATAAVGAAGFLLGAWISGAESGNVAGKLALVAVPALQIHTAVRVELATSRRR
jgi:hypothetical protein